MPVTESFEDACLALIKCLREQGQPSDLTWVFREDITGRRRSVFVHPSPPSHNGDVYRRHFAAGAHTGRGIRLSVLCFAGDSAYCYVSVPDDDVDASQAMLAHGDLCIGFAVESHESGRGFLARRCHSALEFYVRRIWYRFRGESPFLQKVPRRARVSSNTVNA